MSHEAAVHPPHPQPPGGGADTSARPAGRAAPPDGTPAGAAPPDAGAAAPVASGPPPSERAVPRREHRYDIDLMRLICSCAVMLGHVGAVFIGAVERAESAGPAVYWVGHVADSANEFAVPMYFAMAGWAVLVGAPPRDSAQIWQRIVRNGVPLFLWTGAYLAWARLRSRTEGPVSSLALDAVFGSVRPAYHLWFMYAYIPIIAVLAVAVLVRAGQRPWGLAAALLAVACAPSALKTAGALTGWDTPDVGWGFGTYSLVYAVVGAMLFALPGLAPGRRWWLVPVLLAAFAGCLWYNTQVRYVIPNAHLFVAAMTGCVLLAVSRLRVPERLRPLVAKLAGAALGAYMVHVFFVEELVRPLVTPGLSAPAAALLLVLLLALTVVLSYAASLLWGRLRLRRWLG
ncbi:acyltransferase [Streptomyces sp. 549]|uniref:acyltransferase n=1 Tax=Streptomyces sp. 549 TaxID=3049076 RepID=UPI0024C2ABE2|nr:acyltransferase [Streptomyces sp. 549]MDK1475974.1 acyltransferase [Streptomyces sp. 549]